MKIPKLEELELSGMKIPRSEKPQFCIGLVFIYFQFDLLDRLKKILDFNNSWTVATDSVSELLPSFGMGRGGIGGMSDIKYDGAPISGGMLIR